MPATLLLTEALADSLADAVRRGVPIEAAAIAAGVSRQTIYERLHAAERKRWHDATPVSDAALRSISAFSDKIARARAEHEASLVAAINAAVGVVGANGVPEWRPALELLKHHPATRQRWGQHVTTETTVTHRVEQQLVEALPDEAFAEAFDAIASLPPPTLKP